MDIQTILKDPDFIALPAPEKARFFREYDPDYAALPTQEQARFLDMIGAKNINIQGNPDASASETERMRQKFIADEGTTGTRIKETAKQAGRAAMPYVRPLLEAGGAVGGGIVGTASPVPAGALLGAGLGYAAGAKTADILDTLVDQPTRSQPQSITGQLGQSAQDVATGAAMEAGGQIIGKGAGWAWDKGKQLTSGLRRSTPALSESAVKTRAGQQLQENMGASPQYVANAAEAEALEQQIPGYKMSLAERRNDPGLIKLQRGLERASSSETPAANLMAEQKASNVDALKMHLADTFPGEADIAEVATQAGRNRSALETATSEARTAADLTRAELPAKLPQQLGNDILAEIETQAAPVKSTMQKMGDSIPNYPISVNNLINEADGFAKSRLVTIQERRALKPILNDIASRVNGTDGKIGLKELQTVQRNINDVISRELEGKASTDLMALKKAIQDDLDQFSGRVGSGQIAQSNGKLIDLDALAGEFETNAVKLQQTRSNLQPDYTSAQSRILNDPNVKQIDKSALLGDSRRTDATRNKIISDTYRSIYGEEIPHTINAADQALIDNLGARQQQIRQTLAQADPALDAAAMYRAYNKFANEQYFNRFDRGALSRVTRRGNEASGTQTQLANIPAQFSRADGADDLIRAIGPGRATELMDQHFAHDLLQKANPATGELQSSVAQNWLKNNAAVLEKYGLTAKYSSVTDAQAAVEMAREAEKQFAKSATAKILNSDPEKAIEAAFQTYPKNTGRAAAELRDAMKGDQQALAGLQTAFKDFIIKKAEATIKTIGGDNIIGAASLQTEMDKYLPAMRVLFANEPEKLAALQNVQKAVEISARSSRSPLGGGSDTAENLNAARGLIGKVLEHIPGIPGVVKLGKMGLDAVQKMNEKEINTLIARAMYDPDLAMTLIGAAKGTIKPELVRTQLNHHLITMGLVAAKPQPSNQ